MLTAFIGSVINGVCNGTGISFLTGWISWLAVVRILVAGVLEVRIAIEAGTDFDAVDSVPYVYIGRDNMDSTRTEDVEAPIELQCPTQEQYTDTHIDDAPVETDDSPKPEEHTKVSPGTRLERNVTVLGWVGWIWSALYTPVSQTIWLSVHITSSDGLQQLVRALAIGVSALGLTYDYKQRYAAVLGRRYGAWSFAAFNAWNATACLLLGMEALILLIHSAMNIHEVPIPLVVAYPIFSVVWSTISLAAIPPSDGAVSGNIFAGALMGAFVGVVVAAPAFGLWQDAQFTDEIADMMGKTAPEGLSLGDFLACESASVWAKFAAIMP